MSFYDYFKSFRYTSVGDLKEKAKKYLQKEEGKGHLLSPIELEGRVIAKSWWGKAWCDNLESYADFYNRLERGRKYVRNNAVVDLQIERGKVSAKVIGSGKTPYRITVQINELGKAKYKNIIKESSMHIQNIEALINGNFPETLKKLFLKKDGGLFPTMADIHFECSCPDVADMCKHVAAVLYGIGARFDKEPLLFFKLRGIDTEKLIGSAIQNRIESMLSHSKAKSKRIIRENEVNKLFGI